MSNINNVDEHRSYANFAQVYTAMRRCSEVSLPEKIIPRLFIDKRVDINYQIPTREFLEFHEPELIGCTALHLALHEDYFQIFQLLLDHHANFNIQNQKQMTIVRRAIEKSFNEREIKKLGNQFYEYAGRYGTIDEENGFVVMLRIIEGENFYKHDNWRLWGKFEDKYVNSILSACLKTKNIPKYPNNDGEFLFHAACLTNNVEAVDLFLKNGADLSQSSCLKIFDGFTPLHFAVRYSGVEILKALLDNKATLSIRDRKFMSPVDILVDQNLKIVEWLHAKNKLPYGNSILDYRENEEKLNLIIKSNIGADRASLSSFHIACTLTNVSSVRIICPSRGPLTFDKFLEGDRWRAYNHVSSLQSTVYPWSGYTALHFAAFFNIDTAKHLLNIGADITTKNSHGVTPLDILETRATIDDLYFIVGHKESWKCITLSDCKTTLLHLILSMKDLSTFNDFLREMDINLTILDDAPLWPGYTILHLVVTFSETVKKLRFMKNIIDSDRSSLRVKYKNCCEEQGKSYLDKIKLCLTKNADVTIQDTRGRTQINLAFRQREMEAVKIMLEHHDKSIDPTDEDNLSHLHIACAANNHALVEKLLLNGADVNAAIKSTFQWHCNYHRCTSTDVFDVIGSTPLHLGVISRDLNLVNLLLENGADVNAKDALGRTPLHRIFFLQNVWEIAHKFFKRGSFEMYIWNRGSLIGEECFLNAWQRFENIAEELLSSSQLRESVVDNLGLSHLHVAVSENNLEAAKKLLDFGSDINAVIRCNIKELEINHSLIVFSRYDGYTPLQICDDSSAPDTERLLLQRGADFLLPRANGMIRLLDELPTCFSGNRHFIVDALKESETLRRRLQDTVGWTVLHVACRFVNFELASFAFSIGVNVDSRTNDNSPIHPSSTALHILMMNCDVLTVGTDARKSHFEDILSSLLNNGADVMSTDLRRNTPLHQCHFNLSYDRRYSYAEFIYLDRLLEHIKNFSFNPINNIGLSIFHVACIRHNTAVVTKFLDHGVDVNQPVELISSQTASQYPAGSTPLHLAVAWRSKLRDDYEPQLETISLLLKRGADVNARNTLGDTPLHRASKCHSPRETIFDILVRYGADINAKNVYDMTPLETLLYSKKITRQELEFFLKRGCRMNVFNETTQVYYLYVIFGFRMDEEKTMGNDVIKTALSCPSIMEVYKGRTAIHNLMASSRNVDLDDDEVFRYFMERGCDIDAQDESGKTALHLAAKARKWFGVEALLMNGADVNAIDSTGRTAFAYNLKCVFLARFIYHMSLRGLYVNDVNKKALNRALSEFSIDQNKIDKEYRELKDVKIGDTKLTLEDFLSETNAIVYFSKMTQKNREAVVQFSTTTIREYKFTYNYWKFLCVLQYRKALQREDLVESAKNSINVVMGFPLPDLCFEVLEKFLSNADLKNLIVATT